MNAMTDTIVCVPARGKIVDAVWPEVGPMLEKAVRTANGKCTIDDVRDGIDNGMYLLWVVLIDGRITAAITTRIVEYPQCKGMALDWIGGRRMKDWLGIAQTAMSVHAKHNGCTHMEGYGRPAWMRWIARNGWKEDYTAFRMEI